LDRASQLTREYGIAVRFSDFGAWSEGELRAEYDPAVPEIRINRRVADSLSAAERERFIQYAIGHELYHHREQIGEIPALERRSERESAADRYAESLLKPEPRILDNGEVCWKYIDVEEALHRFAAERQIILGFDVVEFVNGKVRIWGTSDHNLEIESKSSLQDVKRIQHLTGLEPPYDDLWFIFVTRPE
jgi:hypothetical protein